MYEDFHCEHHLPVQRASDTLNKDTKFAFLNKVLHRLNRRQINERNKASQRLYNLLPHADMLPLNSL